MLWVSGSSVAQPALIPGKFYSQRKWPKTWKQAQTEQCLLQALNVTAGTEWLPGNFIQQRDCGQFHIITINIIKLSTAPSGNLNQGQETMCASLEHLINFMNMPCKTAFAIAICLWQFSACLGVLTEAGLKVQEIIKRMSLLISKIKFNIMPYHTPSTEQCTPPILFAQKKKKKKRKKGLYSNTWAESTNS